MVRTRTTSAQGVAFSAAAALLKYVRSDAGQQQLRRAPQLLRWARHQVGARGPRLGGRDVIDATSSEHVSIDASPKVRHLQKTRLNPIDRFGQRGLERRLEGVRRGLRAAFGDDHQAQDGITAGLSDLERAMRIAAQLPTSKRLRLYRQIDRQLDGFEDALIAAALDGVEAATPPESIP